MGFRTRFLAVMMVVGATATAHAGGYDTPMLYTARHMGMGGTAQAYVDDPSALFHNPAGLMGTERLSLVADFSLLVGDITASPRGADGLTFGDEVTSLTSETTIAPFFLIGLSGRITDWLTAGFALYPVASAGAEYTYNDLDGNPWSDKTQLVFFEFSPGVAFQIPSYPKLSLGFGYRITLVQLERVRKSPAQTELDFNSSGTSFGGFRVGVQWRAYDWLQLGMTYRHKTETDIEGDGEILPFGDAEVGTTFVLPARLQFGVRSDIQDFSVALDVEYAFNSQNEGEAVDIIGTVISLNNWFDWENALTIRTGLEYRLLDGRLPIRVGYVWDQKTSSRVYATAFGTPPGATHVITAGLGWQTETWNLDVAYAYRTGSADVRQEDFDQRESRLGSCEFCAFPGDYEIKLHGIYLSFTFNLQHPETSTMEEGGEPPVMGRDPEGEAQPEGYFEGDGGTDPEPATEPVPEPEPATDTTDGATDGAGDGTAEPTDPADLPQSTEPEQVPEEAAPEALP